MSKFIYGTIFGIVIATVGITGVARLLDRGVNVIKHEAQKIDSIPVDKNWKFWLNCPPKRGWL